METYILTVLALCLIGAAFGSILAKFGILTLFKIFINFCMIIITCLLLYISISNKDYIWCVLSVAVYIVFILFQFIMSFMINREKFDMYKKRYLK